jgi:O-antigen ligase
MTMTLVLVAGAFVAALAVVGSLMLATRFTHHRGQGFLGWTMPIALFLDALYVVIVPRDVNEDIGLAIVDPVLPPLYLVLARLASFVFLAVSAERIVSMLGAYASGNTADRRVPAALLAGFVSFWAGTVLLPSLFGALPEFSQRYLYPLAIGCAALTLGYVESRRAAELVRDAMFVFLIACFVAIPLLPVTMTLQTDYPEGFVPGLPRLHGIAPHAVQLGQLALLELLLLLAVPYRRRWLLIAAFAVALTALFAAQSKTAWIAATLCLGTVAAVRIGPTARTWFSTRRAAGRVVVGLVLVGIGYFTVVALVAFGSVGSAIDRLLASEQGSTLATLTNRDIIWAAALQEWERHPVFGFGPTLFDSAYRASIGISSASHGHNQLIDTLARAGSVGAAGLILYWLVLTWYSFKYAVASRGLTLALYLMLFLFALTESPLDLFTVVSGDIPHFMLLMVLAGHHGLAGARRARLAPATLRTHSTLYAGR